MDVAAEIINYMDGATTIPWYHDAPVGAPDEYGTVNRDGGPSEVVRDLPTLTLIVHAASRGRAADLAYEAKHALIGAKWAVPNVFDVAIEGDYHDPLDGKNRHRITASLIVND